MTKKIAVLALCLFCVFLVACSARSVEKSVGFRHS